MTSCLCQKPPQLCVCAQIKPTTSKLKVIILQHPQEQDQDLGTARIAHNVLTNSILKVGLSWPNFRKIVGAEASPKDYLALYVGNKSLQIPNTADAVIINKQSKIITTSGLNHSYKGIVVLDGNWSQAKTIWWRNAWLNKMHRLVLNPKRPSLYGNLRKEPRRTNVSSLEAIALALTFLGEDPEISENLYAPFKELLSKYKNLSFYGDNK